MFHDALNRELQDFQHLQHCSKLNIQLHCWMEYHRLSRTKPWDLNMLFASKDELNTLRMSECANTSWQGKQSRTSAICTILRRSGQRHAQILLTITSEPFRYACQSYLMFIQSAVNSFVDTKYSFSWQKYRTQRLQIGFVRFFLWEIPPMNTRTSKPRGCKHQWCEKQHIQLLLCKRPLTK